MREAGFRIFSVRSHGDMARIEPGPAEDRSALLSEGKGSVVEKLKAIGYIYIALDLEGYGTGSMNEVLDS